MLTSEQTSVLLPELPVTATETFSRNQRKTKMNRRKFGPPSQACDTISSRSVARLRSEKKLPAVAAPALHSMLANLVLLLCCGQKKQKSADSRCSGIEAMRAVQRGDHLGNFGLMPIGVSVQVTMHFQVTMHPTSVRAASQLQGNSRVMSLTKSKTKVLPCHDLHSQCPSQSGL